LGIDSFPNSSHNLVMPDDLLAYYATPGPFTTLGSFGAHADELPDDIGSLAHAVQMLLIHRFWAQAYKFEVTPERDKEQGLHGAEAMLAQAMKLGLARIGEIRLPEKRVVGNCRHFSTMLCAFLRQKRIPARARCGFATYFEPGKYVDHWVCEYWNVAEARWVQVDAQLDALQVAVIKPDFDPLDVPRDRFLAAGDVWQQIRAGTIDAQRCGIADMWGEWFVRGDISLDIAALQKVELLPWEPFGIAMAPDSTIPDTPELLSLVDHVASLAARGDADAVSELLALAKADERLRPPTATIEAARYADLHGPLTSNPLVVT
jgi:hypothetical protein